MFLQYTSFPQMFLEMERICVTERLQQSIRESWAKQWAPRIIEQAEREKQSNARLRAAMGHVGGGEELTGMLTLNLDVYISFYCIVGNFHQQN